MAMSREGRRHEEAGRPARKGDLSPAPFLRSGSKHPGLRKCFLLRGGRRERGSRSAQGVFRQVVRGTPAVHAPGPMTEGVRGLREEGILLRTTPSRSSAHRTFALPIGSCSQASAHVARHDGAAGRRKTACREEVVGSDVERSAFGARPRRVAPWPVWRGLVAKARVSAIPKRDNASKGGGVPRGTFRSAP